MLKHLKRMTPLKKPSLADWSSRLVETVGRFPVTFVYIVLATVHLWFVCGTTGPPSALPSDSWGVRGWP